MTASRPAFIEPVPSRATTRPNGFRGGMAVSIALHVTALVAVVLWMGMAPPVRPPQYRIELIGAAGLKKQMGVVADQQPTETAPKPADAPKAADRAPEVVKKVEPVKTKAKPEPKPVKATPNKTPAKPAAADVPQAATKAAPPVAGSGQTKGRGTDVTNMVVEGIQFPFPWYLENIARRISIAFGDWKKGGAWLTEVRFVIHRDGSVTDITILKPSGLKQFDLEGQGAIESVGNALLFGPLPKEFNGETLPVYFTFRPDKN